MDPEKKAEKQQTRDNLKKDKDKKTLPKIELSPEDLALLSDDSKILEDDGEKDISSEDALLLADGSVLLYETLINGNETKHTEKVVQINGVSNEEDISPEDVSLLEDDSSFPDMGDVDETISGQIEDISSEDASLLADDSGLTEDVIDDNTPLVELKTLDIGYKTVPYKIENENIEPVSPESQIESPSLQDELDASEKETRVSGDMNLSHLDTSILDRAETGLPDDILIDGNEAPSSELTHPETGSEIAPSSPSPQTYEKDETFLDQQLRIQKEFDTRIRNLDYEFWQIKRKIETMEGSLNDSQNSLDTMKEVLDKEFEKLSNYLQKLKATDIQRQRLFAKFGTTTNQNIKKLEQAYIKQSKRLDNELSNKIPKSLFWIVTGVLLFLNLILGVCVLVLLRR